MRTHFGACSMTMGNGTRDGSVCVACYFPSWLDPCRLVNSKTWLGTWHISTNNLYSFCAIFNLIFNVHYIYCILIYTIDIAYIIIHIHNISINIKRLRWSRGSVLTFGIQVRGFKPDRSRRIFQGVKNPQHASLREGSKAVCPMSRICGM